MSDAPSAAATAFAYAGVTDETTTKRNFAAIAGGSALLGGIAGVALAVPLAAAAGLAVYVATAIDMAIGLALIGGLIGANIAGTD